MWRLLTNGEEKVEGDETFCMSGRDFGWYKIRTSSSGSLWLEGDLPVRRKISDTSEAEKPAANTGSLKLADKLEKRAFVELNKPVGEGDHQWANGILYCVNRIRSGQLQAGA